MLLHYWVLEKGPVELSKEAAAQPKSCQVLSEPQKTFTDLRGCFLEIDEDFVN